MCYSAQVVARFKQMKRRVPAAPDLATFEKLYGQRVVDHSIKIPRALDANFDHPDSPAESRIRDAILTYRRERAAKLEAELFKQKTRQTTAKRALEAKVTKKAESDLRISTDKIAQHVAWLKDLQRTEAKPSDARVFPFWYAPVIIREGSEYLIRPMRYHCRPKGKPASYDRQYDGLYNARRDNLERFWKNLYGEHHAIVIMTGFYENVAKHDFERRELAPGEKEENLVLHFNPQPQQEMYVACLWSRWEGEGQEPLESFAAITDDPPPEVAQTGHDRCVIQLQEENAAEWLAPAGLPPERLVQILDDKARPYYEHRLAA